MIFFDYKLKTLTSVYVAPKWLDIEKKCPLLEQNQEFKSN